MQKSSDSTEENGNRTEETQHGPLNIGMGQENGNKLKKQIGWSREEMKDVLWCFTYIKENTLIENCMEAYKLWRERNPMTRMNIDVRALLNKNCVLKSKRITAVEIDKIKQNIRLKIGDDTKDYTNGVNGDKMDKNVIEYQKRDPENNNTGFGKVHNNKHRSAQGEQHTFRNKLKEYLQKMWHKLGLQKCLKGRSCQK